VKPDVAQSHFVAALVGTRRQRLLSIYDDANLKPIFISSLFTATKRHCVFFPKPKYLKKSCWRSSGKQDKSI